MDNSELTTPNSLSLRQREHLQRYIQQLEASSQNVKLISALRTLWFPRFLDLCKARLSEVVELPVEFSDYNPSRYQRIHSRQFDNVDVYREEPSRIYDAVVCLMDFMSNEGYLQTPLIFRKSGNIGRQRELCKHLLHGHAVSLPFCSPNPAETSTTSLLSTTPTSIKQSWSRMTRSRSSKIALSKTDLPVDNVGDLNAHDYANVLKTVLREMPEPILTKDLLPIYISVSKLTSGNENLSELDLQLVRAKQQSAFRILTWLLPISNQLLLRRLLDLLNETLSHSEVNGMSAKSLGTIFGPLLFTPSCRSHDDLHKDYDSLNALATIMIEQGSAGVFSIPLGLFNDVQKNVTSETFLRMICSNDSGLDTCSEDSTLKDDDDDVGMYTDIAFAERCTNINSPTWRQATEESLDKLETTIRSLPDSHPRKSYYLRAMSGEDLTIRESFFKKATKSFLSPSMISLKRSAIRIAPTIPPPILETSPEGGKVSCCAMGSILSATRKRRQDVVKNEIPESDETVITPEIKKRKSASVQTEPMSGSSVLLQMPVKRNYGRRPMMEKTEMALNDSMLENKFEINRHSL